MNLLRIRGKQQCCGIDCGKTGGNGHGHNSTMLSKWLKGMKISSDQQEWLKLLLRMIIVTCGENADK